MRNFPCRFATEQCRSALRQGCYKSKEMNGLSNQGSGIQPVPEKLLLEADTSLG